VSGTPLLAQLHDAAPTVISLTRDAPALARAARPTLAKVAPVLRRGAATVRKALPLSRALQVYAHQSLPSARLAGTLLPNLSQAGFADNLMRFFYYATLATSRFDQTSHILPAHIALSPCSNYATTPQDGCSANFDTTARALDFLLGK
jgi:hypothetical protein